MQTGSLSPLGPVIPRVVPYTDAATITLNLDTTDLAVVNTLSQTTNFANPTGTPYDGQVVKLRIKSSTSQSITFGSMFSSASNLSLPTSTSGGHKVDYLGFIYNSNTSQLEFVSTTL